MASERPVAVACEYLSFACGGEEYGVEILRVQEIKGWDHITRVPHAPACVLGVMNLRGMIVPVLDLCVCLGLPPRSAGACPVVIVLRARSARGDKIVGIVVDAVSDVYSLPLESIQPAPQWGRAGGGACIQGMTTVADRLVMLLDPDALVGASITDPGAACH